MNDDRLSYAATGDGYAVYRGGKRLGSVRQRGMYWHAYTPTGEYIRGTFLSMSAAGRRVVQHQEGDEEK
jgi:hypothetical protein